jgi:hypothetical protein
MLESGITNSRTLRPPAHQPGFSPSRLDHQSDRSISDDEFEAALAGPDRSRLWIGGLTNFLPPLDARPGFPAPRPRRPRGGSKQVRRRPTLPNCSLLCGPLAGLDATHAATHRALNRRQVISAVDWRAGPNFGPPLPRPRFPRVGVAVPWDDGPLWEGGRCGRKRRRDGGKLTPRASGIR